MDNLFLIVIGASLLLSALILIPAEVQIHRSRADQPDQLYPSRDYHRGQKFLNNLLTMGFSFLVLYIIFTKPEVIDFFLRTFSLK